MTKVLDVNNLRKEFQDVVAVNDIDFTIHDDEFFSLLGPSGCGKSTTLRCVAGLETPEGGSIELNGEKVFEANKNLSPDQRDLTMVFQNYAVWPHMTVFDNVSYPLKIDDTTSSDEIEDEVRRILEILEIQELEERKPHQLSGGQQQRVALGRALIMNPSLLLLDEPLSNLDAKLREHMRLEIKRIQNELEVPILYVTHDQVEAMSLSDRIAVMSDGELQQIAPPDELYSNPSNQFVFDFIGKANYLSGTVINKNEQTIKMKIFNDVIKLDIPEEKSHDLDKNQELRLGFRPEDAEIVPHKKGNGEGITGKIKHSLFLGNIVDHRVVVGEEEIEVQTGKNKIFQAGDKIEIEINQYYLWEE